MGRRKRDDDGMVGEILEMALDQPLAGFAAFLLFGAAAGVIHVVKPKPVPDGMIWTVFEIFASGLSVVGLLGGVIGAIRYLVTGRDLFGRPRRSEACDHPSPLRRSTPAMPPTAAPRSTPPVPPQPAAVPACPRCHRPMAMRTAGKGPRIGKPFWGCTDYPRCKTIVDIVEVAQR